MSRARRLSRERNHGKVLGKHGKRHWLILGAMLAIELMLAPGVAMGADAEPIEAVWKPQRVVFVYNGYTTIYTCKGLERKLEVALRALGAHETVVFERSECVQGHGARMYVTFKSPIAATEANVRELTTYSTEEQLAARVTGTVLPSAEDLARFPAVWSEVSFARDRRLRMSAGDCELVDNIRRQLVPRMSAQVTANRLFCTPGALGIGPPKLVVSALTAVDAR